MVAGGGFYPDVVGTRAGAGLDIEIEELLEGSCGDDAESGGGGAEAVDGETAGISRLRNKRCLSPIICSIICSEFDGWTLGRGNFL